MGKAFGCAERRAAYIHFSHQPPLFTRMYTTYRGDSSALTFVFANSSDVTYSKSLALMFHLFGTELQHVLLVLLPNAVHIVAGADTHQALRAYEMEGSDRNRGGEGGEAGDFSVKVSRWDAEGGEGARALANVVVKIKASAGGGDNDKLPKVGVLVKDKPVGPLADMWKKLFPGSEEGGMGGKVGEVVDISVPLGLILSMKDEVAGKNMDVAARITSKMFKKCLVQRIEDVIDEDKVMMHDALAEEVEAVIKDPAKIDLKVPKEDLESCYFPIIQSGGEYDIKASAETTSKALQQDIIICSMGVSYKGYCANIARTILVDPPKKVQHAYKALTGTFEACLDAMRSGEPLKAVHEACRAYLEKKYPEYLPFLPKTLGSCIGAEFRDSTLLLNSKVSTTFKARMYFNLVVGFHDVPLTAQDRKTAKKGAAAGKLEKFSLLLADTVRIPESGSAGSDEKLATKYDYQLAKMMWEIGDEEEEGEGEDEDLGEDGEQGRKDMASTRAIANILPSRLRERKREGDDGLTQGEIDKQMKALLIRKMKERAEKAERAGRKEDVGEEGEVEELVAYRSTEQYPRDMRPHQVFVDMEREAVLLPIHGMHVPFHISTIKNVVQPEPDAAAYLRINFYTPGQALGKDAPAIMSKLVQAVGQKNGFVKEMLFRSLEHRSLNNAYRLIQELRKRARQREKDEKEEADLVEQEKIMLLKNQRIHKLQDVVMRPHISGRKTMGTLEAHANGLRFRSKKQEVVDIMYANIRNAIFQPCYSDLNVLIHFHLKDPIMINKKKAQDVQFYTEVVESVINMEGARRSTYDPDEIEEEQRERVLKKRLNDLFKDFAQKVQQVAQAHDHLLEFDAPYRDLAFSGTPHREMVTVHFSAQCIMSVSESPFFVVPLDDIEHVHFERVMPSGKNFDMVIIQKDFDKEPLVINSIPREHFVKIEQTLLDVEVTFTYGMQSWKWKEVLAGAKEDEQFYATVDDEGEEKDPGWAIFLPKEAGEGSDSEDDEDDDSEFEANSESEEEEEDDEDDSEFEEEEDEDEDESELDEEEEEEYEDADWEKQEKRLMAEDRMKDQGMEEENRKRPSGKSGGGAGKRSRR